MKKYILSIVLLGFGLMVFAQQEHQYTLFMYNKLQLNPAYAGERGGGSLTGIYRNQWLGFEGSPESALVSFNTPFIVPRVGMGLTITGQKIGLQRDAIAQLAYSYDLINSNEISLRMGLQGSVRALGTDLTDAQFIVAGDQSIQNQQVNDIMGNFGAGVYLNYKDQFYAGLSVPRIYTNSFGINNTVGLTAQDYRHYYGMFGASIPLGGDLALQPAVLVKYVETASGARQLNPNFSGNFLSNGIFDADFNLSLDIREKVTTGLSYRLGGDGNGESVDLTFMLQATPKLGLGLAYDFVLSGIRDYTSGSVEAMVRYDLKAVEGSLGKDMSNPRFFF